MSQSLQSLIPAERIEHAILLIRGQRVMLDRDLASLYGVETRTLNQAVRRNLSRFPDDFIFQLTKEEFDHWKSQFVTSNPTTKIKIGYLPMAFTEHGIAMLSSVLNSERAVAVNIEIMRTFVRLRQWLTSNKDLARRLDELEAKYDRQFKSVFDAIRQLMTPPAATTKKGRIGFRGPHEEPATENESKGSKGPDCPATGESRDDSNSMELRCSHRKELP